MTRSPMLTGLPPIVGGSPRTLILGNMPSAMSLAAGEYYGNPRNAFWRIMGELLGFDASGAYGARTAAVANAGVAVWDVLHMCRRPGSLDSSVDRDSMVPNDFGAFLTSYPSIGRVFFNGAAAEANFRRLVEVSADIDFVRLPSTSPAQTMTFDAKLAAWAVVG